MHANSCCGVNLLYNMIHSYSSIGLGAPAIPTPGRQFHLLLLLLRMLLGGAAMAATAPRHPHPLLGSSVPSSHAALR